MHISKSGIGRTSPTDQRWEEQFLMERFGEEYARYRREVKRMIPFLL
jgi:hypothetical protein